MLCAAIYTNVEMIENGALVAQWHCRYIACHAEGPFTPIATECNASPRGFSFSDIVDFIWFDLQF